MPTRRWTTLLAATGVFTVLLVGPATAPATAPGKNGQIAFRRYLGPDRTKGAIFLVAPDGTGERQLTTAPPKFSDDYPDMAPDGSFVAFQRCGPVTCGVYVVKTDGTGLRRVDDGCGRPPPKGSDNSYPGISPDGKRIVYNRAFGPTRRDQTPIAGINPVGVAGPRPRRVSPPRTRTAEDVEPQWPRDGRRIVFARHNVTAKPAGTQA